MQILHLSAECYPAAKAGGLADVVGSLPGYLNNHGREAAVVIPGYGNDWIEDHAFETVFESNAKLGGELFEFSIERLVECELGYPFYIARIPNRFDRPGIYTDPYTGSGYWDELERFLSFQIASLEWLLSKQNRPGIIHCHDHHTALVPFMTTRCGRYRSALEMIPTVLTIHNGEYQGEYDWTKRTLLPQYNPADEGLLDWNGQLNSLAAGVKCCWKLTSVSESYMRELAKSAHPLSPLFKREREKSTGIINGIDTEVWNPETDRFLEHHYSAASAPEGKAGNKRELCDTFDLGTSRPVISFIGRLVREKGADLLPDLFKRFLESDIEVNFIVLGTGDPVLHERMHQLSRDHVGFFDAALEYNEPLAHLIYAGSDFLVMPSRVEPCGLNQMYAMRYGTLPVVRETGGLKDTVVDIQQHNGYGITFNDFTLEAAGKSIRRAINLYKNQTDMTKLVKKVMNFDFSWNASAEEYIQMYNHLETHKKD